MQSFYPSSGAGRTAWILERRPPREALDPLRPYAFFVEDECSNTGEVVPVATVFLTNRECPWRCLMCDLWRNTLPGSVPLGAIPAQIDYALSRIPPARQIKLYNSGSFFDPGAIPAGDYGAIAARVSPFERVIVENHPALVSESCVRFHESLAGRLEVAMGLETVHPGILPRLNKRMTLHQFSSAADLLRRNGIDLRAFILVQPPFMRPEEALHWSSRSLDFAFDCGAAAATLIPTRAGNGAMETLAEQGQFTPPDLATLEAAVRYGLSLQRGRVFADTWALDQSASCPACRTPRVDRLREMNLRQTVLNRISCKWCEGSS